MWLWKHLLEKNDTLIFMRYYYNLLRSCNLQWIKECYFCSHRLLCAGGKKKSKICHALTIVFLVLDSRHRMMIMVTRFLNIFMQLYTFSLAEEMSGENLNHDGLMGNTFEKSRQHRADDLTHQWPRCSLLCIWFHLTFPAEMRVWWCPSLSKCHRNAPQFNNL